MSTRRDDALYEEGVRRHRSGENDLDGNGLLDPDQPTREATEAYRATRMAEFTPQERWCIRIALGLGEVPE